MSPLRSFAAATGQRWKYRVRCVALAAAVVASAAFFSLWIGNPLGLPGGVTTGIYFAIAIFAFAWDAAAIRCPSCGVRVVWHHMTHGSALAAEFRISMTRECPSCGFNPSDGEGVRGAQGGHRS